MTRANEPTLFVAAISCRTLPQSRIREYEECLIKMLTAQQLLVCWLAGWVMKIVEKVFVETEFYSCWID
jgi:hypothetical protein